MVSGKKGREGHREFFSEYYGVYLVETNISLSQSALANSIGIFINVFTHKIRKKKNICRTSYSIKSKIKSN